MSFFATLPDRETLNPEQTCLYPRTTDDYDWIPGEVALDDRILGKTPEAVLWVERVRAFPNYLTLSLRLNIDTASQHNLCRLRWPLALCGRCRNVSQHRAAFGREPDHCEPTAPEQVLRFGVSSTAGRATTGWGGMTGDRHTNEGSVEDSMQLLAAGGFSGGGGFQMAGLQVTPPDFDRPLTLHAMWPALDMVESSIEISEAALSEAHKAIVGVWPSTKTDHGA